MKKFINDNKLENFILSNYNGIIKIDSSIKKELDFSRDYLYAYITSEHFAYVVIYQFGILQLYDFDFIIIKKKEDNETLPDIEKYI